MLLGDVPGVSIYAEGQVEALRALRELGCPMDAQDAEGCTAAHLAAARGQVRALRGLGCPMDAQDAQDAGTRGTSICLGFREVWKYYSSIERSQE